MPKMKTHRGAAKRFKKTGTGKIVRHHAFTSHILGKKSPKRKRALGKSAIMHSTDAKRIANMIAYM
ncbi:MAG: 50S ribosomal protein L35 [Desulfitobacteriaceae bacterium]